MTNVALTGLARELAERADRGRPVRIGVIGSGEMGTDLVTQCMLMRGVEVCAVSTRRPHTAREAIRIAYGDDAKAMEATTASKVTAAIEMNRIAITSNELLVKNPLIDVVIDATGKPGVAADFDLMAMEHGKHVVMMNVEADVTIGPYLKQQADRLGVNLFGGRRRRTVLLHGTHRIRHRARLHDRFGRQGQEQSAQSRCRSGRLSRRSRTAKHEPAHAGRIRRRLEDDGGNTAAIANATGLVPECLECMGRRPIATSWRCVLIPREDGGILSKKGVVDYTIGKGVAPGVFVIVEATHPRIIERMDDLHVGKGPYYSFFRPYHLTSLEVPLTAALIHASAASRTWCRCRVPWPRFARSPSWIPPPATRLDAIGETCYRSWTMTVGEARMAGALSGRPA